MKTAEEIYEAILNENYLFLSGDEIDSFKEDIFQMMKEYAKQAIDKCAEVADVIEDTPRFRGVPHYTVNTSDILKIKEELK